MDIQQFEGRKKDHIRHALNPSHQTTGLSGLEEIHLFHEAIPDFDFEDVSLESSCLGTPTQTPFYVAGMTAGHPDASAINRVIAQQCAKRGWAMGVGSQRRELEAPSAGDAWTELRSEFPQLLLFANIGITQLSSASAGASAGLERVLKVAQNLKANALIVHTNPLQEAIQPEGTPHFKGAQKALAELCKISKIPVVLKETGCGFSEATLTRIAQTGLAAVDISGMGGTHWGRIEGARANPESIHAYAAQTFANWGESTVDSVLAARRALQALNGNTEIWGSGGVRSGLDAAKLIALGAHRVGYAQPVLEPALKGSEALGQWMGRQEFELRVALFCTGCKNPSELAPGLAAAGEKGRALWKRSGI